MDMGARRARRRKAEVSRAPHEPCCFCGDLTRVRVSIRMLDEPGTPEVARRICVACFKAMVDHLTGKPDR